MADLRLLRERQRRRWRLCVARLHTVVDVGVRSEIARLGYAAGARPVIGVGVDIPRKAMVPSMNPM